MDDGVEVLRRDRSMSGRSASDHSVSAAQPELLAIPHGTLAELTPAELTPAELTPAELTPAELTAIEGES